MNTNLMIENAHIIFRNFSGKADTYNRAGDRNFAVEIEDQEKAERLREDGWNVKEWTPEDGDTVYYLPVKMRFDVIPPKIYRISSVTNKKIMMTEENISQFDSEEFRTVDIIIRPYNWDVNGKSGTTAYVKTMYVTIEEDEFARKYESFGADASDDGRLPL